MATDNLGDIQAEPETNQDVTKRTGSLQRWIRAALIAVIVLLGAALLGLIVRYAQTNAVVQAEEAAQTLSDVFAGSMATAEDIAGKLTWGALPYDDIAARLKHEMDADPTIDGITVAFATGAYSDEYDQFIAFLLPALVAGVMVFGYLLNGNKPDEPEEIVTALSYTAALFFVIAVVHASLRESAAAIGLTYLEYLYLFLYVAILLVAANTFVFVRYPNFPLVRYGDNLISKLLYWPTLLAGTLAVTVWIFVYSAG